MAHRYIALLRGINVGTSGRIRMDALKKLLEDVGFSRVSTYIQSGNVLFSSDLSEAAAKEAGIAFQSRLVDSRGAAQNAPAAWTNYALFYNGTFVTHEILSVKKFLALAGKGVGTVPDGPLGR